MNGRMTGELERIWRETAISWSVVLFQHFPEGAEDSHDKLQPG
jgi:hypothetical protein